MNARRISREEFDNYKKKKKKTEEEDTSLYIAPVHALTAVFHFLLLFHRVSWGKKDTNKRS